jgi:hypothetical protein
MRSDEFSQALWQGVARFGFGGERKKALALLHLTRGYERGISREEVLERIAAGELERS